ncbi:MAG: FkbM family methyltransferase [Pyrinomonadaceae bacterium]|nr:FkbM family methyltransferase [Pyrinomonadaceae bacterium]
MSTALRLLTVKLFRKLGVKHFRARSGLSQPFICHLGDSHGENPYYNFATSRKEIVLMASWCRQFAEPMIVDVGGNVGFVATQLAQLIREQRPRIFSFEPVPLTFQRLTNSIRLLKLEDSVYPICAALSDTTTLARITYSEWDTMFAQINAGEPNARAGDKTAWCPTLTLDELATVIKEAPALVKIDVEGHEVNVLRGGSRILSSDEAPAICFESNPVTLSECQSSVRELAEHLADYELFYVDDFEGQRMSFGEPVADLTKIDWVCNIFAVPRTPLGKERWSVAIAEATSMLDSFQTQA